MRPVWLLPCLLLLMPIGAAGCSFRPAATAQLSASARPSLAEMQALLLAQLAARGIDPDKAPAAAPSGNANAVFNLSGWVLDPDGAGPQPPTSVDLSWVERLVGDFNQDGEVGISDLTPLGQHFNEQVLYDAPALHNNLAYWPQGYPTDDGGVALGSPAAPGSGAAMWRLARTDGDGNGVINISDITPLGAHFSERLDGYRIYRSVDGGAPEQLLNKVDPLSVVSIERTQSYQEVAGKLDPSRPIYYTYDDPWPAGATAVSYFVAAYDAVSDGEGPPCLPFIYDLSAGPRWRISVVDYDVYNDVDLVFADKPEVFYGQVSGGSWLVTVNSSADATGDTWGLLGLNLDTIGQIGSSLSAAVINGRLAVAFNEEASGDIRYIQTDASGFWPPVPTTAVSAGGVGGTLSSISLAQISGAPAIAFYDGVAQDLMYIRANDPDGTSWPANPVALLASGDVGRYPSLRPVGGNPAIAYISSGAPYFLRANDPLGNWGVPVLLDGGALNASHTTLSAIGSYPVVAYSSDLLPMFTCAASTTGDSWNTPTAISTIALHPNGELSCVEFEGNPAVVLYAGQTPSLWFIQANDPAGSSWEQFGQCFDPGAGIGWHCDMELVWGHPAIAYVDTNLGELKYAVYY